MKMRLDEVLSQINKQKNYNILSESNKIKIYHDIVKHMVSQKFEYSLANLGEQNIFENNGIQDKIEIWLYNEHGIKCRKKYNLKNNTFYNIAFW